MDSLGPTKCPVLIIKGSWFPRSVYVLKSYYFGILTKSEDYAGALILCVHINRSIVVNSYKFLQVVLYIKL